MPAFIALDTGVANVVSDGLLLMTVVAIPAALAEIAVCMYVTISDGMEFCEPPHLGFGSPSSAAASLNPNWVGTKNRFVVTWLTNQNCHGGVFGKFPTVPAAADAVDVPPLLLALLDELHAASRAEAAAVALTRPVPVSSLRRDGPSFMFSVCIASSTFGSTFFMRTSSFRP